MDWDEIDWTTLERLRSSYLEGSAGERDYWQTERDLANYDLTYAQRIGWKWDYVLAELRRRGWSPPGGPLLDWGCGSGIAGRAWLGHFGLESVSSLLLWDRSPLAMSFAKRRAEARFRGVNVCAGLEPSASFNTLLISHVLTELNDSQAEELLTLATSATTVIWVEPGTHQTSRRLSQIRDRLQGSLNIVAPCTHSAPCPVFAPRNAAHWCHHFASPPPAVFTDGNWARFAKLAGIDLRSLPLSYLVMDKRPIPQMPPGATRVLGRPRVYKGYALLLGCDTDGLHERRLSKRTLPDVFRELKKGESDPLQVWECANDEIQTSTRTAGT